MSSARAKHLLILIVLLFASAAFGQTYSAFGPGSCNSGGTNCTITGSAVAGNNVFVGAADVDWATGTFSVHDTDSDTFTPCAGPVSQGTTGSSSNMYAVGFCATFGTSNASEVITITFTNSNGYMSAGAVQFSGGYTTVDKTSTASTATASTAMTSGATATTSAAVENVIGFFVSNNYSTYTHTATGGYTQRATWTSLNDRVSIENLVTSSAGVQTATANVSTAAQSIGLVLTLMQGVAATPTASPVAGTYLVAQSVALSDSTGGATINYCYDTTNTCTPSTSYSSAVTVSATGYLRAQANGTSAIMSAYYVINPPDQTGSYAFSDNLQAYYNTFSVDAWQQPLDSWNTNGQWTANGTVTQSSQRIKLDTVLGGTAVQLYGSDEVTFTGATGWNGTNAGQFAKGYIHSGQGDGCVSTFSDPAGTVTDYTLCVTPYTGSSGTASLSRSGSGGTTIASVSGLTIADGSTIELRSLNGQHQTLINGSAIAGMCSPTCSDSTLNTGNPGMGGTGLYNPTVGTINASTPPTPITWAGIPNSDFQNYTFALTTSSWPNTSGVGLWWDDSQMDEVLVSGTTYGAGASSATDIKTSTLKKPFKPAQFILWTQVNSTTSNTERNHFARLQGNTAQIGGVGCYDRVGYYGGVEPMYQEYPTSPYPTRCGGGGAVLGTPTLSGGGLATIPIISGGGAYNYSLSVTITGGGGTGAAATPILSADPTAMTNYKLTGFTITPGSGYTTPPTVTLVGGTVVTSLEYCGTNLFHVTKATAVTIASPPSGGCSVDPNYEIWTVNGILQPYIPMQGDQILFEYDLAMHIKAYCKGGGLISPVGYGCPSTTQFFKIFDALDTDMGAALNGHSLGNPGLWASKDIPTVPGSANEAEFQNVTLGSIMGNSMDPCGSNSSNPTGGSCNEGTTPSAHTIW